MSALLRAKTQLDLKDLHQKKTTSPILHIVVGFALMVLVSGFYLFINSPSAFSKISAVVDDIHVNQGTLKINATNERERHQVETQSNALNSLVSNSQSGNNVLQNQLSDHEFKSVEQNISFEQTTSDTFSLAKVTNNSEFGNVTGDSVKLLANLTTTQYQTLNDVAERPNEFEKSEYLSWDSYAVVKGDSLSAIFRNAGVNARHAYNIVSNKQGKRLLKIKPQEVIRINKNIQGELQNLAYSLSDWEVLLITYQHENYQYSNLVIEPEIRLNNNKAVIDSTLLGAAKMTGVGFNTMYKFMSLFGWQVDFAMDIRKGDRFSIIYEELFVDNKKVKDGDIVAAELITSGKRYQAIRHIDETGVANYYAPNGESVKGAFLRTPIKLASITSGFSRKRFHPSKKVWRPHRGVDYGAPRGTPILATGDGVVKYAHTKDGYGNVVMLRHGTKYETLYAHMHRFANEIKPGRRVKQGQVIGYVGSTGQSTGPHLHYEFRIHGEHKNPVTVSLPKSAPIDKKYQQQFQLAAKLWKSELEHINALILAHNTYTD